MIYYEFKDKVSKANTGRKLTKEQCLKMSISRRGQVSNRKGVKLSEETKTRISESKRGNSYKTKPVYQFSLDFDFLKYWNSVTEAARFYNIKNSVITKAASKINKTGHNYIWNYNSFNNEN